MKHFLLSTLLLLGTVSAMAAERIEKLPFGDMDHWAVRYIKESRMLGGRTKVLYTPAATDTLRVNVPFPYGQNKNPWSVSNAYAKVCGIEKASCSTRPEKRGDGYCARMDCKLDSVVVGGVLDLKVLVAGTLFTGQTLEPVGMAGANDPYAVIPMGIPFTGHPTALMLDYKALVKETGKITQAKATAYPKDKDGSDACEMYIMLQQRWEDADGNIYARRVATGYERITRSVPQWQNDHRIPIYWGDIRNDAFYHPYMGLNTKPFRAMNSKGKVVKIQEVGYSVNAPTHMIIMLTSSQYEAFIGQQGNTLWVDNIRLVYDD